MPNKYEKFYNNLWSKSFYHPDDVYTLVNPKKAWNKMSDYEKIIWYCKETSARWDVLKSKINPDKYFEIEFDNLFEEEFVKELSSFLNLEYSKENFKKVANK